MRTLSFIVGLILQASTCSACQVILKHSGLSCPAVTYGPDDCAGPNTFYKVGKSVGSEGTINVMESGHVYFCIHRANCFEKRDVMFKGCTITKLSRYKEESKEYHKVYFVR